MKKISVKEFMKKYNALTSSELKKNYAVSVINNKYIPYEKKATICEKIVESSYYIRTKDTDGTEIKKFHVNSVANYMLFYLNVIDNYTSIAIDFKNSLEEFNLLNESECIDIICEHISEREMKELRMILEMVENDLLQNEYETHAFIRNQVERFADIIGRVGGTGISRLVDFLEDEKQMNKMMGILDKVMNK